MMIKRIIIILFVLFSTLCINAEKWDACFVTPSIVRVQWSKNDRLQSNNTGICNYTNQQVKHKELSVVHNNDGSISFCDKKEKIILTQLSCDTLGNCKRYIVSFHSDGEKAVYGLGSQMEDYMNLQGKTLYLTQHNLKIHMPLLISTNGYGLLFDAGCAMKYTSEKVGNGYDYTIQFESVKELDYYFIYSPRGGMEGAIAGYRYLTGNVAMMPRYLFGYTQSKERYVSSNDIISTLKEYRRRHVPIDMIVQDWNYWPQGWGYMKMNPKYYPNPKSLADSVHQMHAKLMVSVWPNPQWCPEADDFKSRGMMLPNDIYDAFNPEARKLFWKYANDEFFSKGFDAWWCDSSEPLDGDWNQIPAADLDGKPYGWNSHEYRWQLNNTILSQTLGAERSSLYSLYHAKGIYENQRRQNSEKRVVNLTRSSYAGQQRYATIVWNGDTHASWESFRQQIPAGLNYMATGNPYWTVDVGCFFVKNNDNRWYYKGEFPNGVKDDAYKEFYVRMFQWATFLPVLRSHGSDTPREIWQFGEPSTPYYDAIRKMINFRYAHFPYIYSMAAMQSNSSYSMARMLAFDFASDENVLDLKDEYIFGNYLVCPVTHPLSETSSRKVYLPEGTDWYDYWTNKTYKGGQWIDCESEISKLPLFVKSGSIIPTTEIAEYTDAQIGKPITINVYPGADAEFTLYEDEGDNYNYEKGDFSTTYFKWDDKTRKLSIGKRKGKYNGMVKSPQFVINIIGDTVSAQTSPNGKIKAEYVEKDSCIAVSYNTSSGWQKVMSIPTGKIKLAETKKSEVEYEMPLGKKSHCTNTYKENVYDNGLIVRVYNDGVAWTGRHDYVADFSSCKNHWLQKWTDSYEGFFPMNSEMKVGDRYGYPALFEFENDVFSLLSESCMTATNAATSMHCSGKKTFSLLPDGSENGGWQTLIIGHLDDIVESTLITDNSEPCKLSTQNWISPGLASWVYWANNHGSNDYSIIKKYTDMAVKLKLPYVLIDAEWDEMDKVASNKGKTIADAVKYAVDNGVKPLIWYSSSIGWVDGAPGPKFKLNKPEDREREFAWCEKIGIKGVKIDFFSGDTNQNIKFMIELLECAAKHHLLVNFHGATIPRGWQRTYPNLVSTEGVYGAEWYNNVPTFTNKAAWHNTILPFTRNVVGSMDYTPCAFSNSQHPHITTHAHELALTVLYESSIQHLADRPESFLAQPQQVQDFLSSLPAAWDETKFLGGYPSDYVILARRKLDTWYIAGINGTDNHKTISIPTFKLENLGKKIHIISDSGNSASPWKFESTATVPTTLTLLPRGGCVIIIKK